MRRSCGALFVAVVFVFLIAGCPQKPADDDGNLVDPTLVTFTDPQTAAAKVKLPTGVATDITTLKVATNVDDVPVGADGSSVPQVIVDFPSLVLLVGPDNKTLLLSFLSPGNSSQEISTKSTAVALLYFALGAWNTPPQNAQNILDRIAASQAAATLAAVIETAMASNPTALTDGNQAISDAIKAGAQTLINDNTPGPASKIIRGAKNILQTLMASSNFQLLISPESTTIQSGVQVLQNPDGDGVIAQNNFRRRGVLYAYLVGTKAARWA